LASGNQLNLFCAFFGPFIPGMKECFLCFVTGRCSRQKCRDNRRQEVVSNFNCCRFSSQIACVLALLGSLFAGLNFAFDFTFISVWKWLCICIFFFTALEVKRWHSEICQLPKYLFFIWIWVASAPRMTSRRFSPVAGAYGDHCFYSYFGFLSCFWPKYLIMRYIKVKKETDLVQHANHNHNETVFLWNPFCRDPNLKKFETQTGEC